MLRAKSVSFGFAVSKSGTPAIIVAKWRIVTRFAASPNIPTIVTLTSPYFTQYGSRIGATVSSSESTPSFASRMMLTPVTSFVTLPHANIAFAPALPAPELASTATPFAPRSAIANAQPYFFASASAIS